MNNKRNNHKKLSYWYIILLAVVVIALIALYFEFYNVEKREYYYKIEIIPNGIGNYSVFIPAPLDYYGEPLTILKKDLNYLNTTYGKAIEIDGNGYYLIEKKSNSYGDWFSQISMANGTLPDKWNDLEYSDFWVFANLTENINKLNINIEYSSYNSNYDGKRTSDFTLNEEIYDGWQLVIASYESETWE